MQRTGELMERGYPFDPSLCIGETAERFQYTTFLGVSGSWGQESLKFMPEERYLQPCQYEHGAYGGLTFEEINEIVPTIPRTPEALEEAQTQAKNKQRGWGASIVTAARQEEDTANIQLVSWMHREKVIDRLGRVRPDSGYQAALEHLLENNGHVILKPTESEPMQLAIRERPAGEADNSERLTVVDLDLLHAAKPSLLPGKIMEWHLAGAQADFAKKALYYLMLHESPQDTFVLSFIRELSSIDDPERREAEIQGSFAVLNRVKALYKTGRDVMGVYAKMLHNLQTLSGILTEGIPVYQRQNRIWLSEVLKHVGACTGSGTDERLLAFRTNDIRTRFLEAELIPELPPEDAEVLTQPSQYLFYLWQAKARLPKTMEHQRALEDEAAFMQSVSSGESLEQVIRRWQAIDPERISTLHRLQEKLESGHGPDKQSKTSRFSLFIDKAASDCLEASSLFGLQKLDELRQEISRNLQSAFWTGEATPSESTDLFEGIKANRYGENSHIYADNPHLRHTLTFLTLVHAHNVAEKTFRRNEKERLRAQANLRRFMDMVINDVSDEATATAAVAQHLNNSGNKRAVLNEFLARHQLEESDFAPLNVLASPHYRGRWVVEHSTYTLLANLIVMTRHGQANIFSRAQRALVEDLFRSASPGSPDKAEKLQAAWLALDRYAQAQSPV